MTSAMKLAMLRSMGNGGDARGEVRNKMRGGDGNMEMAGVDNEMRSEMESAFRDNRGRRHYNNGRYAPKSEMEDTYHESPRMTQGFEGREVMGFRAGSDVSFPEGDEMESRHSKYEMGRGSGGGNKKLDKHTVETWLSKMKNADESKGPHWSMEQVKHMMTQRGIDQDLLVFWATLNMMYSDYCKVAQKHGLNNEGYYADLAEAFLDDEDVKGDKLSKYYFGVVKA